jgi:putative hydrolase of the HAD superfamily
MSQIKVVSFDVEGTLVTSRFSQIIWQEAVPTLFARKRGISLDQAKQEVLGAYQEVGERRKEWYDIKYWFKHFGLAEPERLLVSYRHEISYYPEVLPVLSSLGKSYERIVVSNSTWDFLGLTLEGIKGYLQRIFSAPSDLDKLKCPDLYLEICQILQISPQEMVHVGDSREFDFDIPREAGIRAFHLDRLGKGEGDGVITDLRELANLLL